MNSLLNAKACVGVRSPVIANSEERSAKRMMQNVNCRNSRNWRNVAVSCGSEKNGNDGIGASEGLNSGSFLSPSHNYAILKHRMEIAAKSEVSVFVWKESGFFVFYHWCGWFLGVGKRLLIEFKTMVVLWRGCKASWLAQMLRGRSSCSASAEAVERSCCWWEISGQW